MSFAAIIGVLVRLCVLTTTFALGLHVSRRDIRYLLHKPGLLVRSILATYVLTPLIAVFLARVFAAPVGVELGLLLLTLSSGAPTLPKKLIKLGLDPRYMFSLAVIMALIAVVSVPVSLVILRPLLPQAVTVSPSAVALVIAKTFLGPLVAGILIRSFSPAFAERVRLPLMSAAGLVLLGVVVLILAVNFSAFARVGFQGFLVIVLLTLAALAVGHLMGGPERSNRTTLALACATRSPALALLIASESFPNAKPLPIVAGYLLAANLISMPYMRWSKNRRDSDDAAQPGVAA